MITLQFMSLPKVSYSMLTPTFQFSKGVVAWFTNWMVISSCISMSQLSNRKCVLVCQISTVFTPCLIILVTITFSSTCTAIGHSTCTFSTVDCRSPPVIHFWTLTWYPPTITNESAMITFIFYKLFTILGLLHNGNNLFHGNVIFNLSFVRTWRFISLHKCSWFTVMSNHCHTNTILWRHITVYLYWRWYNKSLRIKVMIATSCWRMFC